MSKILDTLSCLVLILCTIVLSYAIYLQFWDTPIPVIFKNSPFPVDKAQYLPGDAISMYMEYSKYTDVVPDVTIALVDGTSYGGIKFSGHIGVKDAEGKTWISNAFAIPNDVPPGEYHLSGIAEYKINTLRTIRVQFATQEFEVLPITKQQLACLSII